MAMVGTIAILDKLRLFIGHILDSTDNQEHALCRD